MAHHHWRAMQILCHAARAINLSAVDGVPTSIHNMRYYRPTQAVFDGDITDDNP